MGKTKRGKGTKWMVVQTAKVYLYRSRLFSASPAEVILAEETLSAVQVPRAGRGRPRTRPARLICDRAYDSQRFRERLAARGIELICPHRRGRKVQLSRMDARGGAIAGAGKWSAPSPIWVTSGASSFATHDTSPFTKASST